MEEVSYRDVGKMLPSAKVDGWYYIIDSNRNRISINGKVPKFKTKGACARKIMQLYTVFRKMAVEEEKA